MSGPLRSAESCACLLLPVLILGIPTHRNSCHDQSQNSAHSTEGGERMGRCFSIPGIRGWVPRYQEIEIEYMTCLQKQELTDFVAGSFQHEYDHLDGIVFYRVRKTSSPSRNIRSGPHRDMSNNGLWKVRLRWVASLPVVQPL